MGERRIVVWVQRFPDRANLVLQWHQDGRRRSKSAGTPDQAEAERQRSDLEYELNHGLRREPSSISWDAFRQLFEAEYLSGRREGTRDSYDNTLDTLERLCEPQRLKDIDERVLSRFVAALRTTQRPNTVTVKLAHLRAALRWAQKQKMILDVPAFPVVKVPRRFPQPVPSEPVEKLLVQADPQMRVFLLCAWLAGLRFNEALELEREPSDRFTWVDWTRSRIVLPAEFVKGDADQWVPLDPELNAGLTQICKDNFTELQKVFRFTGRGGHLLSKSGLESRISRLAELAGVRITMRTLRRGFCSRYAARVPAQVLQKLARHSKIQTTLDFYTAIDDAVEAAVFGQLPTRNGQLETCGENAVA